MWKILCCWRTFAYTQRECPLAKPYTGPVDERKIRGELLWLTNLTKESHCACGTVFCNDSVLERHQKTCVVYVDSLQVHACRALHTVFNQDQVIELILHDRGVLNWYKRCRICASFKAYLEAHKPRCDQWVVAKSGFSVINELYCFCGKRYQKQYGLVVHQRRCSVPEVRESFSSKVCHVVHAKFHVMQWVKPVWQWTLPLFGSILVIVVPFLP